MDLQFEHSKPQFTITPQSKVRFEEQTQQMRDFKPPKEVEPPSLKTCHPLTTLKVAVSVFNFRETRLNLQKSSIR